MIDIKFQRVLKYLTDQNVRIDKLVSDDVKCIICDCILDCAIQALCGCRFCPQCMDRLLISGIKYCPGPNTKCKKELLSLDDNIQINLCANEKLSKVFIQCPKTMCSKTRSLENIEQHMESCGQEKIKCPFLGMGCTKKWIVRDRMRYHLFWHKEKGNDLWMSNTITSDKNISNLKDCIGNIFVEIAIIKASLHKIDTMNQIHRKEFQDEINNLRIEFQGNLNKITSEVNGLKHIQNSTENSQFIQEFQEKLINDKPELKADSVNPEPLNSQRQNSLPILSEEAIDIEKPIIFKDGVLETQEVEEVIYNKKKKALVKLNRSSQIIKPSLLDLIRASSIKRTRPRKKSK